MICPGYGRRASPRAHDEAVWRRKCCGQLALEHAPTLDKEAAIDRFVRHLHVRIARKGPAKPARNLLRRPLARELRGDGRRNRGCVASRQRFGRRARAHARRSAAGPDTAPATMSANLPLIVDGARPSRRATPRTVSPARCRAKFPRARVVSATGAPPRGRRNPARGLDDAPDPSPLARALSQYPSAIHPRASGATIRCAPLHDIRGRRITHFILRCVLCCVDRLISCRSVDTRPPPGSRGRHARRCVRRSPTRRSDSAIPQGPRSSQNRQPPPMVARRS